jgi:hypothetical protein
MKITSKTLLVNVEFPIEVGQLKTTAIAQLCITKDDKGENEADVEFVDTGEITYMGMIIEGYTNWKKFKNFHNEMGLNFDKLLDDEFNKVMTNKVVEDLIKNIQF